ncbi:MAG: hypothetical protein KJO39_11335 [Bacteroidia bacterium]|nr:hypothetical protein [Bacteroidia bacterium]
MENRSNKYLIVALVFGIAFHGTSMFFTLESTYDALIHVFFGNHYATSWFEPWNESWYTGFTVMGYPPLVHQAIALLSGLGGLKFGMFVIAITGVILFITGVYRFTLLLTSNRTIGGYAAILAVFSSSFVETLHLFGQLPSIIGISILLHALPEIYLWLKTGKYWYLVTSFSLLSITVTSHHVTPIFGMVFFIFPLIGMVLMDASRERVSGWEQITLKVFVKSFYTHLKRILVFGLGSLVLIIICILPYWINTKDNPITQVPIPHGSRDNFIEVSSSGLVFFLIPWGVLLILLPYLFYRYYSKRYLFFGLSFSLLTLLGTGGTTPLPLKILGENAFNILTLDRFTLWASIMALPMFGEFTYRFVEGDLKRYMQNKWGAVYHRLSGGILLTVFLFMTVFSMSLGYFRPSQPKKIDTLPLVNFLNQDQHDKWRYLPLGFGDQMAWLSTQTKASTIDGNYHSARRLPELTSRAVERLENSKFRGVEGLGSLQQFLTIPEKYHLKYVFSNDKFYDPILYFTGWHRLQRLENGIMVWEREGVSPMPSKISKKEVPLYQKLMWGIIPILTVIIAFFLNINQLWKRSFKIGNHEQPVYMAFKKEFFKYNSQLMAVSRIWAVTISVLVLFGVYSFYMKNATQISPENTVIAYYDALDFKEFEKSYGLINPKSEKTLDQYMLEISVTDGLLSSYAKLDAIEVKMLSETDSTATAEAKMKWITPLETYNKSVKHQLRKIKGNWFLEPSDIDVDIPPDQLFIRKKANYFKHGRRRISSEQTYHEDVLKQPAIEVLSASLVYANNSYHIVGEIQNIDNIPADVSMRGTLYSKDNRELTTYNAKDILKHKLLPKETSVFRIDFEDAIWSEETKSLPATFNPKQFTPVTIKDDISSFNLQVEANIATTDLHNDLAIADLILNEGTAEGIIYNSGIENATIPQLLVSFRDRNRKLIWVEKKYLEESVRAQRKYRFEYIIPKISSIDLLSSSLQYVFVNGLPNNEISKKLIPERKETQYYLELQEAISPFRFIDFNLNYYVGNPR